MSHQHLAPKRNDSEDDMQPIDIDNSDINLYDTSILEACHDILEGYDALDKPYADSMYEHTPAPKAEVDRSLSHGEIDLGEIGGLALSLEMDDNILSADDVVASVPADGMYSATVYVDDSSDMPPTTPTQILPRERNGQKKLGRQKVLAGMMLVAMIAAIAVGVSSGFSNRAPPLPEPGPPDDMATAEDKTFDLPPEDDFPTFFAPPDPQPGIGDITESKEKTSGREGFGPQGNIAESGEKTSGREEFGPQETIISTIVPSFSPSTMSLTKTRPNFDPSKHPSPMPKPPQRRRTRFKEQS